MHSHFLPKLSLFSAVLAFCGTADAQLRVGAWNITNFGSNNSNDTRSTAFKTAIFGSYQGRTFSPDVLFVTELTSSTGQNTLLAVLNTAPGSPGDYAVNPFNTSPDTTGACYYRTSKVQYLGSTLVSPGGLDPEPPRNTYRYDFRPAGYPVSASTIAVYNVHFKAGSTSTDEARRFLEAQRIRTNAEGLPTSWSVMVVGDLNVQGNGDNSYVELTGSKANNLGRVFDPIDSDGNWNNSNAWRFVHTQDPWNGTSAGGMDDRFDFILMCQDLLDGQGMDYIGNWAIPYSSTTWNDSNHSYRCWGNDGSNFNTPLNTSTNAMVGSTIASALMASLGNQSGHLPVFVDLKVPPRISADASTLTFPIVRPPLRASKTLTVTNSGNTSLWNQLGVSPLTYQFQSSSPNIIVPTGVFTESSAPGGRSHTIQVVSSGTTSNLGTVQILSNDPVTPVITIDIKQDNQRSKP